LNTQQFSSTAPPASLHPYAISSLNSLMHGGASETLFIPGEDPAAYYRELDEAFATHQPATAQDAHIVTESVHARWMLSRRHRTHNLYEATLHDEMPDPTKWSNEQLHRINLMDRYKTQAERAFRRSLANLQSIRKEAFAQERWREHLKLAIEKTELQRQKFAFAKEKYERPFREAEARAAKQAAERRLWEEIREEQAAKNAPIQNREEFGGCAIVQKLCVHIQDDQTIIGYMRPSNKKVRQIIAHRASYAVPPQKVVRNYLFTHNIPKQYEFLIDEYNPRPVEDACGTQHQMSFDDFHQLSKIEDRIIATQPNLREDDDDGNLAGQ
jgi:hypothetical protein